MAVPSTFTLGSLALVVAAGVGLVAVSSAAGDDGPGRPSSASSSPTVSSATPRHDRHVEPGHHGRSDKPAAPRPHRQADAVPDTLVMVYNNSGVRGLAAAKSRLLQGAGWNVAATDDWYGNIAANTVYYPGNLRGEARQLAKVLHVSRLHPAVSPMQFDRLTVIFTSA